MRESTIARSYAEALFTLAERAGRHEAFTGAFDLLEGLYAADPRLRLFLASPRIEAAAKKKVLQTALKGRVPDAFLNFLMVVIGKRRQRILPAMGQEYRSMLDERMGVLHVKVSLAHEADERAEREIATALTRMLGKRVIPQIGVEPALLGGIVVRYGDRILDASLRRRLAHLRARLLEATLPTAAAQP